jgi:hypothetical protein
MSRFRGGARRQWRRQGLIWTAVSLLGAFPTVMAQQRDRRVEPAAIPVRYSEGTLHGFLELRTATGTLLAHGDVLQVARETGIESRVVFHFLDASVFEETVTYTQHGVFTMEKYHLVQSGPAFADDIEATLSRSGQYLVRTKAHKDGKEKEYSGTIDLPPDVYNGMVITIAKNLVAHDTQTVHIVAFTPQPRVIGLEFAPSASPRVMLGQHAETAVHFTLKPKLGALLKLFATLMGKAPPDADAWIVTDDLPAFVLFEGPMYSGPVWRLTLGSPNLPPLTMAHPAPEEPVRPSPLEGVAAR